MIKNGEKFLIVFVALAFVYVQSFAQESKKPKINKALFKDTLDNKFDFSRVLMDAHGFLPVLFIITEPAFGGFGGGIAPVFISPKKNLPPGSGYVAPDITAGFAMYTLNGSWGGGMFRSGSFPKRGLKYRVGAMYTDMNLDFYRTLAGGSEKEYGFNIKTLPLFFSLSRK
ncbi:MAG TPA: hypothetical protein VLA58_02070, partial [Chitinophagaceae bacterium]|nr:hypothetical protein [Chitinophagaceae bacterium]